MEVFHSKPDLEGPRYVAASPEFEQQHLPLKYQYGTDGRELDKSGRGLAKVFTVKGVDRSDPPVYCFIDDQNSPIEGTFYEQELHKVSIERMCCSNAREG